MKPRLRPHLLDHAALVQTLHISGFDLPALAPTLPLLDGTRAAETLDPTAVRWLLCVNALEGAGDAIVEKIGKVGRGELKLPTSILEGARFECQGSGECCQNYHFGPLEPDDVARLDGLDLRDFAPPYIVEREGKRYLRSVGARCVFLEPDCRCGLHARFGAESKPHICRRYPITSLATIEGLRIFDAGTCATFAVSARSGLPIIQDLDRIRALLPGAIELYHPVVNLGDVPCDFGWYLRYTTAATVLVKRRLGTAATTLQAIGRMLAALADALRSCPLAPGQPDAAVARALDGDHARHYAVPAPEAARGGADAIANVGALLLQAVQTIAAATAESGPDGERLLHEIGPILHAIHRVAHGEDVPAAAVEADDPEIDDVLRISMRQQLFGLHSTVEHRAGAALIRIALMQLCAVWGARLRAHEDGRGAIWPEDLSHGHMLAARVLEHRACEALLARLDGRWPAVLDGLPSVLALGYGRPMP